MRHVDSFRRYVALLNRAMSSTSVPPAALATLRNGALCANAAVGRVVLGRRYSAAQLASVALVSAGRGSSSPVEWCHFTSFFGLAPERPTTQLREWIILRRIE